MNKKYHDNFLIGLYRLLDKIKTQKYQDID